MSGPTAAARAPAPVLVRRRVRLSLTLYDDVHILDAQHEPPVWYSPAIRGDARPAARCGHSATLLADGQSVVVFGGDGGTSDPTADPVAG